MSGFLRGVLEALTILLAIWIARYWPLNGMASYDNDQLEMLCAHYGTAKLVAGSEEKFPPLVEPTSLKDKWVAFKQLLSKNYSLQSMAAKLFQSDVVKEQYPGMLTLLAISLTLPVSKVDCKRGFSKHNLIKTRTRARLKTDHLDILMKMSLDTPELCRNLDEFDFHRSFVIWCNMRDRLICRKKIVLMFGVL